MKYFSHISCTVIKWQTSRHVSATRLATCTQLHTNTKKRKRIPKQWWVRTGNITLKVYRMKVQNIYIKRD